MGTTVIEQWKSELLHCKEWGNATGVERAIGELRSLGVDVTDDGDLVEAAAPAKKAAPRKAAKKAAPPAS
jgi:2-phospho-L-lactate guanylyltransferase (CobY/MobA/RfbA family)